MEKTNFVHLHIYKLSEKLADEIWKIVVNWNFFAKNTVGIQIVKAADSVGANIAEGSGRGTDPELRRFLRVSRGSLYETQHWLRRAYNRGLLSDKQINILVPLVKELTPRLNAYLGSIGSLRRRSVFDSALTKAKG
ncbi:MAG TPA: four helix bundle protein [Pyrinomonadaceae bacterium]|jgi:four helix bundle protein|nr:four helix bundle protein [Pyrinomonadaceae bacterium]